ncbi:MAG: helix-turn-helix domain-containing protein [Oscillospiraceae bacterium]|nr:helix-turn-helix domain-containing protein [Oscillospiraceae bacterium]
MLSLRLKELRKIHNVTQKQVAAAISITERNYQRLESGENPNYCTLNALADYFNVSIDYIVGRSDDPKRY